MTNTSQDIQRFRNRFLLALVLVISLVFLMMIRSFVMAVLLAAIFSGMAYPLYSRLLRWFGGRKTPASVATILVVLFLVVAPFTVFLGVVVSEAVHVRQDAAVWIEEQMTRTDQLESFVHRWNLAERVPASVRVLIPTTDEVMAKMGEAVGRVGTFLVNNLAAATRGTMAFFLDLFIMLYAMFFFLVDGRSILERILFYIPLSPEEEERLVERFVSVTRATLKGSLVIGVVQGALAGLGFWAAGIPGPAFWATVMAVLSIIPALGTPLIWVPAVIYLFVAGNTAAGAGLLLWCGLVVGTADNFLRPRLVGRDTKMSDLLVLLSTLGGLLLFGAVGFIIGPIVAALFVTVWELYGTTFRDMLPEVRPNAIFAPIQTAPVEDEAEAPSGG